MQMPPGSAKPSSRAATLTPSPKMSPFSTTISPTLMPMRNSMRRSGGTAALSLAKVVGIFVSTLTLIRLGGERVCRADVSFSTALADQRLDGNAQGPGEAVERRDAALFLVRLDLRDQVASDRGTRCQLGLCDAAIFAPGL